MKNRGAVPSILGCAILFAVFLLGCQNNSPLPGTDQVVIASFQFNPASITISKGTTITWTNNDSVTHTITSGVYPQSNGLFNSGNLAPSQSFTHTFDATGTFHYYCGIHSFMTGTIIVQ